MRDPVTGLERLALARLPTPMEPAPRLAAALGLASLAVKREDLTGVAFGGNKLRQIDYLLAEAEAQGADTVLTTAAAQSNFCRALAGAAAVRGLRCALLLRAGAGTAPVGNLLLDRLFGAEIAFTDATDPWDPAIGIALEAMAGSLRARGRRPWVIQLPGASAALAAAAWAGAAPEFAVDFAALDPPPQVLALACGSGLTLAGLALGFARFGVATRLLGVSVQQPAARLGPWVAEAIGRAAALLGWDAAGAMARVTITDDQVAPGYGRPSEASLRAVLLAARSAGLVLDPVYTGKALAGLAEAAPGAHAAFLHSGGTPTVFAMGEAIAAVTAP
jgi:1-aminocyclopropane-1-carboxylate deaminase/D-cysteine desulfhydrase-like pyridoxal-dependent ACC family enzyme